MPRADGRRGDRGRDDRSLRGARDLVRCRRARDDARACRRAAQELAGEAVRMTYREMDDVLGGEERESEAVHMLGRWRDRTKTIVIAAFGLVGLVPAAIGYDLAQDLQFAHNGGRALLMINVAGAVVPWLLAFVAGAVVARRVVAARMPA